LIGGLMAQETDFVLESELDNGAIKIFGEINEEMAEDVQGKVFYWNNVAEKERINEVTVFINSYGGCCASAISIINSLKLFEGTVITYVLGDCMSAATTIAACGDWRKSSKDSIFMFHGPRESSLLMGTNETEAAGILASLKLEKKRIIDILYREIRHKKTVEIGDVEKKRLGKKVAKTKLEELMENKESYMTALDAKKLGIVDEVI